MRERTITTTTRSRVLNNVVSPYGLALFSYAFFWLACLIPPSTYRHYMMEPDLMFLDPATILFYTACVAAFLTGVWLWSWLFPSPPLAPRRVKTRISPVLFLLGPLTAGTILASLSSILLLSKTPAILLALAAQQGGDMKGGATGLDTSGTLDMSTVLVTGIIWWAIWRYPDLDIRGWKRYLVSLVLAFATVSVLVSATLTLSRSKLMMFISGMGILYILRKQVTKQMTGRFILVAGSIFGLFIIFLFSLFSFFRGTSDWSTQIYLLGGYTVASYNRLAAELNGLLRYPYAGHGLYISNFLSFNRSFNHLIPVATWMHWPTNNQVWSTEFSGVTQAGLLGNLIWSGAFGYLYSDLGWYTPAFIFIYGLMYGAVWNSVKAGKAFGAVLYPCFAFCILFWLGSNYLLASDPAVLVMVALALTGYEFLFTRHVVSKAPLKLSAMDHLT